MVTGGCQKILENGQTSGNLEMENKWAKIKSMTRKSHNHGSLANTMRKKHLNNPMTRFNNDQCFFSESMIGDVNLFFNDPDDKTVVEVEIMIAGNFDTVQCLYNTLSYNTWMKVFMINPEFRILRLTFHRKSASKC